MRLPTGYAAHPAYFGAKALHLLQGADSQRITNKKPDELRLAVRKACRLQDRASSATPLRAEI